MRGFLLFSLFLCCFNLQAQVAQHVFEKDFNRATNVLLEENNGNFYLETFNTRAFTHKAVIYAYDSLHQLRWQLSDQNAYFPTFTPISSKLIDINDDYLLFMAFPGEMCSSPLFKGFLYLVDKTSGEVVSQVLNPYYFSFENESITYAKNQTGTRVAFRGGNELYRVEISGALAEIAYATSFPEDQEPVFWRGDTILYVVHDNGITNLRVQHLDDLAFYDLPLPVVYGDEKVLSVNGRTLIYTTAGDMYSWDIETGDFNILNSHSFTKYKIKQNGILFHDDTLHHYFWYDAIADSLTNPKTYDNRGCTVNDIDFKTGQFYVAGSQTFGNDDTQSPFAFWLNGTGDSVALSTPDEIAITEFTLDSLTYLDVLRPPDANVTGYADIGLIFTARIVNTGTTPIDEFTIVIPDSDFAQCGDQLDVRFQIDSVTLAPGASFLFQNTALIRHEYVSDEALLNFSTQACVGRPNGNLELSYVDNYLISNSILISSTNDMGAAAVKSVVVAPNPSNGTWTIQDLPPGARNWSVYNLNGRLVQQGLFTLGITNPTIRLDNLNAGVYLLRIPNEADIYQAKLVKQ